MFIFVQLDVFLFLYPIYWNITSRLPQFVEWLKHCILDVEIGPFNSPSIGQSSVVQVSVSPEIANGEVVLELNHDLYVEEPDDETLGATVVRVM